MFENPNEKSLLLSPVKNLGIFVLSLNYLKLIKTSFKMSTIYFDIEGMMNILKNLLQIF